MVHVMTDTVSIIAIHFLEISAFASFLVLLFLNGYIFKRLYLQIVINADGKWKTLLRTFIHAQFKM